MDSIVKADSQVTDRTAPSLWSRLRSRAGAMGRRVLYPALVLHQASTDSDTPAWARGYAFGALSYLVFPLDAIPDFTPMVGYGDDLVALTAAMATIALHIKDAHRDRARVQLERWLG